MLWRIFILGICLCCSAIIGLADEVATYQLSPQDEISVSVLRHQELTANYVIPPDGAIDFPRAGRVQVTGKTTAELATALKAKYSEFLVNPEVTVVLLRARQKMAFISGEVAKPGQYPITETTRVTELIAAAGDLIGERIELSATLKHGETVSPVDLQGAVKGDKPDANLRIQEGDQLMIIAPVKIMVVVMGQVKNPGPLKLRQGSTTVDALAAAGDVTDRPERMRISLVRGMTTTSMKWNEAVPVQDGDVIQVEKEKQARIYINGSVKNPGAYDLPDGGGVLEAIALAGGVLPTASLVQITIVRKKDDSTERINLAEALTKGVVASNPKLGPEDSIIVPESTARIAVWGTVRAPGKFSISETTPITVMEALSMAGGADKKAKLSKVTVFRSVNGQTEYINVNVSDILNKKKSELNIALMSGDVVYVPESDKPNFPGVLSSLAQIGIIVGAL